MLDSNLEDLRCEDRGNGTLLLWSKDDTVGSVALNRRMDSAERVDVGVDYDIHIRLQAIEHLIITVLANDSQGAIKVAREVASFLSPDPGVARYSATRRTGDYMKNLIAHAERIRGGNA